LKRVVPINARPHRALQRLPGTLVIDRGTEALFQKIDVQLALAENAHSARAVAADRIAMLFHTDTPRGNDVFDGPRSLPDPRIDGLILNANRLRGNPMQRLIWGFRA
jgi:hypothetical protein